jgi:hypothetical protein
VSVARRVTRPRKDSKKRASKKQLPYFKVVTGYNDTIDFCNQPVTLPAGEYKDQAAVNAAIAAVEDAADIKAAREAMKEPGEPIPWETVKQNLGLAVKTLKVAVVGFASNSRDLAPYSDHSWEIWGLNNLYKYLPRWTRWFEMHDPEQIGALYGTEYVEFLQKSTQPVYMQKHYEAYPASIEFPRSELAKRVQSGREFWPSSISYMLALAIDELTDPATGRARAGAEIGLYGIDLLGDDEYSFQREGCGFLVGVAEGRGIKVTIPPAASLLKHAYMYGYEVGEHSPDQYEVYLASQAQMYGQKRMEALAQAQTFDGAMQGFQTALTMYRHQKRGGALAQPETKPAEAKAA